MRVHHRKPPQFAVRELRVSTKLDRPRRLAKACLVYRRPPLGRHLVTSTSARCSGRRNRKRRHVYGTGAMVRRWLQSYQPAGELVPAPGVEPGTFGLQNVFLPTLGIVNQTLAALANLEIGVIKSQLRHSQSGGGANAVIGGSTGNWNAKTHRTEFRCGHRSIRYEGMGRWHNWSIDKSACSAATGS